MTLSVIIVNYRVGHFLHQCLRSVERAAHSVETEIIVVDNASGDGSVEMLRRLYPAVTFIESPENLGFARANNLALRRSRGRYALLLNPDTLVPEDLFADAVRFLDSTPRAGCMGVKMLKADGRFALESRRGTPTPFVAFCKMAGLCALFPRSRTLGRYYMQYLDPEATAEIEVVSGACMFLRQEALGHSGLLDKDYFMYGEDIDLSYRIRQTGYTCHYLPHPILHYKGESTERSTYRHVRHFYGAMLIFLRKHYASYRLWFTLPIRLAIYCRAVMAYLTLRATRHRDLRRESLAYMQRQPFYVLGTAEDAARAEALLRPYGISTQPLESTDLLPPLTGGGTHRFVVRNAETTPYATLLAGIERRANTAQAYTLATLYPSQGWIITPTYIFKNATEDGTLTYLPTKVAEQE